LNFIKSQSLVTSLKSSNSQNLTLDKHNEKIVSNNINDLPLNSHIEHDNNESGNNYFSFMNTFKMTKSATKDDIEYYSTDRNDNNEFIQNKGGLGRDESFKCLDFFFKKSNNAK